MRFNRLGSSPLAPLIDFLYPSNLQVFCRVVGLAEMGCNRLVQLPRSDVRVISVHPNVESVLCFPYILQSTSPAGNQTRFLDLHVIGALMLYCRPVFLLLKMLHMLISLQHLHRRLLQGVLPVLVGGGWSGYSGADEQIFQIAWSSE